MMILAVTLHTAWMGMVRGINITAAHGYLPPMWLISSVVAGLGGVILLIQMFRPSRQNPGREPVD